MAAGSLVAALGMIVVAQAGSTGGPLPLLVGFAFACVGIAVPSSLGMNPIMGAVPPERAGSASGLSETSGEFGIALGAAVIGSVATAIYRATIDRPTGLPASTSGAAREGLPGAADVSAALPGPVADQVLGAARDAFVSGIQVASIFGAAVFAAMAAASLLAFRQLRPYAAEAAVDADRTAAEPANEDRTEAELPDGGRTDTAASSSAGAAEPALAR